jgi:hypothetical protein
VIKKNFSGESCRRLKQVESEVARQSVKQSKAKCLPKVNVEQGQGGDRVKPDKAEAAGSESGDHKQTKGFSSLAREWLKRDRKQAQKAD